MGTAAKGLVAVAALAAVVVLFIVLQDSDSDSSDATTSAATSTAPEATTTGAQGGSDDGSSNPGGSGEQQGGDGAEPKPPKEEIAVIEVKGGQPVGGVQELEFTKGEDIRFKVVSDVTDEVHLHGYDVSQEVKAGGSTTYDVPATIEGVFEVELEESVVPIGEVTVSPS